MTNPIDRLCGAALARAKADRTDGELLECFVVNRDEASLAALVRRHGPMVWGVCRRILRYHHDVEDAFQATFLVLVRKAASVVPREMVGNWLYGVARQTALKASTTTARRQAREKSGHETPEPETPTESEPRHDLEALLDRELSRLSDKYRVAIVLCDLEGKARKEAARQLKIPEGTLSSRLTTARRLLAKRLARNGLVVSAGPLAIVLSEGASACVPPSLVPSTIRTTKLFAAGGTAASGVASAKAAALAQGVIKAMFLSKIRTMTGVLLILCLSGLTWGVFARGQPNAAGQQAGKSAAGNGASPDVPPTDREKKAGQQAAASDVKRRFLRPGDSLRMQASNTLPAEPIYGVYRVEAGGTVALGLSYGRVQVNGLTVEEAQAAILRKLSSLLREPEIIVVRAEDAPPFDGGSSLEARIEKLEGEVRKLRSSLEDLQKRKK